MKRFLFGCLVVLAAGMALAAELLTTFVGVESGESVPVRLENRAANTTVRAVVCGTELKSASPTTSAVSWDTTRETDGWHTYTSGTNTARVLVRNAAAIAVEGGRLQGNTTWSAAQTHIVRNRVIVPNGVRLTIEPGTVVKFGEGCGIDVESGGALSVAGNDGARSVLTSIADDSFGGDTDLLSTNAVYGSWNITSSGSYDVYYTHVRYGTIASLPTVSMPASVTAQRIEGKARIPLTLSGTRSNRMSLHWKAVDGTAKYGVDYTLNEGEAVWANSASTTQYFEIPLVKNDADEGIKTFRIQMVSVEDCNPNPQRIETTVTIVSGTSLPVAVSAESDVSAPVRLENRLATMVAHALVHGTEWKSADSDSVATAWDTTKEAEGWMQLADAQERVPPVQVLVRNDKSIAIEGGRVTSNETWSATQTHIVRNWVIVPSGVTLTVDAGAIVKFAELTGIRVEDGGLLRLSGSSEARITLTSLADDGVGGDTDLVSTNAVYGSWSVSGSVSDAYAYVRYGTISALPTVSMPASVTAQRSEGKVRVPVTLSGTRSNRMAIHWRAIDGTAKAGVDFLKASGEETFANTSSTTVYFEIPLSTESAEDGVKTFEIELVSAEDINVDVNRLVTKVTIVTGSVIPVAKCAESEVSESVRLENRTVGTTGRALAHGTEWKASAPEACATSWNTMNETDGWHTLTADTNSFEVLVRNDASIAVEGGRLSSNETWTAAQTHLVRNWVIVPSGVTLTVVTNAVVKFCESTGIKVESGGSLVAVGATNAPAVFTSVADDVVGGDTDLKTMAPTNDLYSISVNGTFMDTGAVFHYTAVSGHPTVSLPGSCEMNESHEQVQIPISVSGSRSTPYRVYWRAIDDSATYPGDYTVKQGVVEWSGSSSATQYIVIPVLDDGVEEETERFKVELYDAQGANISRSSAVCTVTVRDSTAAAVPLATCTESAYSEPVRLENRAEGTFGKAVVRGVEWRSASGESRADTWDTTTESDGWKRFEDGTNTADVVVRNDSSIAVEGGRLSSNETWTATQTHLVRHRVIVPSGVTLTVVTNSVVKFCENTGITVESGGRLQLLGDLTNNVYLTTAADDTVGGNTDLREASSDVISYTLSVSGTLVDENAVIRGTSVSGFGTASVDGLLVVDEGEGVIRIPVYVSGSRSTQFSVDWKTSDGQTGQLVWPKGTSEGMKWVTLNVEDCSESFTFELSESRGINISTSGRVSRVKVYGNTVPTAVCVASDESAPVRLENRGEGTFAKALVNGETWKSATGETRAEVWDTTVESDGWKHLEDGETTADVLVRNDPSVAIAGGRLLANATWSNNVTHVVRNWVVIPSGVTLTIAEGSVVKFAERTGFRVETGGKLIVAGTEDLPVVYTSVSDDTIGGETDMREKAPVYGDYSIEMAGGTYTDTHCAIRYATFSNLGTASLPADVVANERDGVARIPLFVNTSRTQPFCVDWRVRSGTYASSGRVNWNTYSEGTKYIQIPLTAGTVTDGFDDFTIELYESQGINLSTSSYTCKVRIYADENVPMATCANSDESAPVRLENRDPETSYGAIVVYGTEWKSVSDYDRAEEWDTTQEEEGWYDVRSDEASLSDLPELQLLVRNDESIVVEGGRLNETTTWDKDKVHLVRNWVIVPSGVTLTIAAGTVVKFCDQTGIKVEAGGRLNCAGTSAADVTLTSIHDDTIGGETDLANVTPVSGYYSINCSGTFTDTYTAMRYGTSSTFGSASTTAQVIGKKDSGHVRIPVTISGSRSTPFAVDWVAIDGTAKFGEDYLCASGRIDWASSSQGTKYIDIPLDRLASSPDAQRFTVKFTVGRGVNLGSTTTCEVFLYDTLKDPIAGSNHGYAESEWSEFTMVDSNVGREPKFVFENETLTYSTEWAKNGTASVTAVADAENTVRTLHDVAAPSEGSFTWSSEMYEDGRYNLSHRIIDNMGKTIKTDYVTFIVNRDVLTHGGLLTVDETWGADKVHLIKSTVYVPSGVTLTIAPDAIVKFMPGTGIVVEAGGLGICRGAIITHAYDDALGGDTFFDGEDTLPSDGAYKMTGDWEDDEMTQYHYDLPIEVGGTISENTRWPGYKTYKVKSSITLASGVTLDIEPGAVIKFGSGMSFTVNSGATLNAQGTRSAPIVFTSIKDDEFGGDTNGDGESSLPMAGDWVRIYAGGTLNMNYCRVRYCNNNSDQGAIQGTGGSVTFDNGIIEASVYECVRMNSGKFVSHNSIFRDASMGFGYYGGNGVYVYNAIVADCTTACRASNKHFYNTIFYRCQTFLESTSSTCDHCVFFNPEGYGAQNADQVGSNSNIWGDPGFADADAGDYRITEKSICVDAGDGSVSGERDFYNQPRRNITNVTPTGIADTAGCYPDIGLFEVQPRFADSDIDIVVKSVVTPSELTVGEKFEVSWRIANVGSADAEGPWVDKVELVSSDGTVALVGTYLVKGGLAAGGERVVNANFRVPSAPEGASKIRVTVNYARDLYEGAQIANNVCLSNESKVCLPCVDFGEESAMRLKIVPGGRVSYVVTGLPVGGGSVLVHSETGDKVAAYIAFGKVPTGYVSDSSGVVLPNGDVLVSFPAHGAGQSAYLMIEADTEAQGMPVDVTVNDAYPAIYALSKTTMPNAGTQSLVVFGVGLDNVSSVKLVSGDAALSGTAVHVVSASELSSSFNLVGAKTGAYRVVVTTRDGVKATSSDVVSVMSNTDARANLEISLQTPSAIRPNRWYEAIVTVKNTGDADAMVPIVVLNGTGLEFKDPDGGSDTYESILQLLPLEAGKNLLAIGPGEERVMHVTYKSTISTAGEIRYGLLDARDADWLSFIAQGTLSNEAWDRYKKWYTQGFDGPYDFFTHVLEKTAVVACVGFAPVNALRLYDVVQREKEGELTGVVVGTVVDTENVPVPGLSFAVTTMDGSNVCHVVTDSRGAFVAYGIDLGMLAFPVATGEIHTEEDCVLSGARLDGVVLRYVDGLPEEDSPCGVPSSSPRKISSIRCLPGSQSDFYSWLDGASALCVGDAAGLGHVIVGDRFVNGYKLVRLSDGSYVAVGTLVENGTNRLFSVGFDISGSNGLVVSKTSLDETGVDYVVDAFETSGDVTVVYAAQSGDKRCYYAKKVTVQRPDSGDGLRKMALQSYSIAAVDVMDMQINDTWLLGLDIGKYGFGIGFEPLNDTGDVEEQCCMWSRNVDLATVPFGVKVGLGGNKFASAAFIVNVLPGGGHETTTYLCERSFLKGGSCDSSHKMMTASEKLASGRCEFGVEVGGDLLQGSGQGFVLKGAGAEILKGCPFSLKWSGRLSATVGRDLKYKERMVPSANGAFEYFHTEEDKVGLSINLKLRVSGELNPAMVAGYTNGKFFDWLYDDSVAKGEERFFNVSAGGLLKPFGVDDFALDAKGEGEIHATKQFTKHNGHWYYPPWDVSGSVNANIGPFWLKGTPKPGKLNDWNWTCGLANWMTKPLTKTKLCSTRSPSRLFNVNEGTNLLFEPEELNEERTLAVWNVARVAYGDERGYLVCREYIDESRIPRKGAFFKSEANDKLEQISDSHHDVSRAVMLRTHSGLGLIYSAVTPALDGNEEDLLCSYLEPKKLYFSCLNGGSLISKSILDSSECCQSFDVFPDSTGERCLVVVQVASLDETANPISSSIKGYLIEDGKLADLGMVVDLMKERVVSIAGSLNEEGPTVVCVIGGGEGEDDRMDVRLHDGSSWCSVQIKTQSVRKQGTDSALGSSNGCEGGGIVSVAKGYDLPVQKQNANSGSGNHGCSESCHCQCQEKDAKPRPGCACPISCKCKGLCPLGECKCYKNSNSYITPQSCDPNEMVGPTGVGEKRYVKPGEWMNYTIYFENQSNATASAQDVWVTLPKDVGLAWETFELGEVVFGDNIDTGLSGKFLASSDFAIPGTNWYVHTEVTHTADAVLWHLRVVDPTTGDKYPADPYAGFLPPNNETGRGEGHLGFRVKIKENAAAGCVIRASATIVFDANDPIETDPAWWNTVADMQRVTMTVGGEEKTMSLIVGLPYGELPDPGAVPAGHSFGGWFTGPNGTGRKITADSIVQSGDGGLFQYWLPNTYKLSFNANGGTVSQSNKNVTFGTALGTLPTPTRSGYTFAGWKIGGTSVTAASVFKWTADQTAIAQWTANPPPVDPTPVDPQPVDPTPVDPTPVDPTPVDPTPVDPTPVDPTPVDPTPTPPSGPTAAEISDPANVNYDPTSPMFVSPELYQNKAQNAFVGNAQYLGWVRDANGALKGTLLIKSAKEKKKDHTSKLSVSYTPLGGKKTTIKNLQPVNPVVGGNPVVVIPEVGTVTLGDDSFASAGNLVQVGQDFTKSKDKAVKARATSRLAGKVGNYTFALGLNGKYVGFTVAVDKKGKGKLVGVLPDGTKVSISSQGVLGDRALAIPFVYSKKGSFGFVFWVYDNGTLGVSDLTEFKNAAGQLQTLSWHGVSRTHELAAGSGRQIACAVDDGTAQTFSVANNKWTFPKKDANPCGWKMSYKAKDGSAKGQFTVLDANGKKVKYTVNGAVVDRTFYGTAYNKKTGSYPVTAE